MVSSGAALLSPSARASAAVAARAPIDCFAMRSVDAAGAEQVVQALPLQVLGGQREQVGRDVVAHQRERLAVRAAQPLERVDLGALGQAQVQRDGPGGGQAAEADHGGGRIPAGLGQVVVQAGELDLAADLGVHDLGADAALADQQAAVDQVADGLAHGRPGQAEPVGQVDLVLEPGSRWPARRTR